VSRALIPAVPEGLACPACQATDVVGWAHVRDREYRTSDEVFSYYRCNACQVIFIHPMPLARLNEIYPANYYSFKAGESAGGGLVLGIKQRLDERQFRALLADLPGRQLAVLDVGGGAGWLLSQVRASDPRVGFTQVVDLDPGAAETARSQGHAYFCGPIEAFESQQRFDLVLLLNLIEHVADPLAVLTRVKGLLAPGGRVLVKTPNVDALDARLFRHRDWGGYHSPRHWVLFTRPSFEQLAHRAGLAVRRFAYTQGAPFWATSTLFALEDRGLVMITRERPVVYHPLFGVLAAAYAAFDFLRLPFAKPSQMVFVLALEA